MATVRRSLAFSFGEKYVIALANVATTMILARLLLPAEVGVYSVAMAFLAMIHPLREFGVGNCLIQVREPTTAVVRTCFTISLCLSGILALATMAAAGSVAGFYQEPALADILHIVAANLLLIPLGAPGMALLRREMAFDRVAAINIAGALANALTALVLAARGWGAISLAWGSLAGTAVTTLTAGPGSAAGRRCIGFALSEWRLVLGFGGQSTATSLVGAAYQAAPDLIIGRVLGVGAAGLYSRANGLIGLFGNIILDALQPVLLPALAAQARRGENLRAPYLLAIECYTALFWPYLVMCALMAEPVVRLLLGPNWLEVAPVLRILSLAAMANFAAFLTYPVLVAVGRVRDVLWISLIIVPPAVLLILAASFSGLWAVAAVSALIAPANFLVSFMFIRRHVAVSLADVARATRKSLAATVVTAVAPLLAIAGWGTGFAVPLEGFAAGTAGAAVLWLGTLALVGHPLLGELRKLPWWPAAIGRLPGVGLGRPAAGPEPRGPSSETGRAAP